MITDDFINLVISVSQINFCPMRNDRYKNIVCLKLHDLIWDNTKGASDPRYEILCYALYQTSRMTEDYRVEKVFHELKTLALNLLNPKK